MNAKLAKNLRRKAKMLGLRKSGHEQLRDSLINVQESERGFYRHLKRNVKEITQG